MNALILNQEHKINTNTLSKPEINTNILAPSLANNGTTWKKYSVILEKP